MAVAAVRIAVNVIESMSASGRPVIVSASSNAP